MRRQGYVFKETFRVRDVLRKEPPTYRAEHLKLGKTVEILSLFTTTTPTDLGHKDTLKLRKTHNELRFKIQRMASFSHPRICSVLDIFEEDETFHLVAEIPQGLSLRQIVENSVKPLDQDVVMSMSEHLLKALCELQEKLPNLVLGNLNPDTIYIDNKGRLQLACQSFLPGRASHTELYQPPESQLEESFTQAYDLYSLGAVLYFALTGLEIPNVLNRISKNERPAAPSELKLSVTAHFWNYIRGLMSLIIEERPAGAKAALEALESCQDPKLEDSEPEATWLPEQEGHLLASSKPYGPFQSSDWILKMVQAAVVGQARALDVNQSRRWCQLEFRLAAPDVPSPRRLLEALIQEVSLQSGFIGELACGLRMAGEFRDFSLVLDDWKHSWVLECTAGKISGRPTESLGRAGLIVQVHYNKHDRAQRTAEDMLALTRRTRLCQVPLSICGRPLEFARPTEPIPLASEAIEIYLASASLPQTGLPHNYGEEKTKAEYSVPLAEFRPQDGQRVACHLDIRCYVSVGSKDARLPVANTHFERRPSRVLWYRRGVLCAHQELPEVKALEFDFHVEATDYPVLNTGLTILPPDWVPQSLLREEQVREIVKVVKHQLRGTWEDEPTRIAPFSKALVGVLGVPLLMVYCGFTIGSGLLLLKKSALSSLFKAGAAAGGVTGFATSTSHVERVRKTCLKAIATYEAEEPAY